MTAPLCLPSFPWVSVGLRQWAERKRRGPLTLETWLSLVEITLETFGKQRQVACKVPPPPPPRHREEEPVAVTYQLFYFVCVGGGLLLLLFCFDNHALWLLYQ